MSPPDDQGFQLDTVGDVTVVRFAGPNIPAQLGEPLYDVVDEGGRKRFLLDFGRISYLSSNGVAILVVLKKHVDRVEGTLKACRVDRDILELFELTAVDRMIPCFATEEEALAAF